MSDIFFILVSITALFFLMLGIKELVKHGIKEKFCVICTAVSLTWLIFLVLYWTNVFDNPLIIALLIGESVVGIFYLVDSKAKEEFKLFRLPFFLTLIVIGYSLIEIPKDIIKNIVLLLIIWIIFGFVYLFRNNRNISLFVKKLVECCKRW